MAPPPRPPPPHRRRRPRPPHPAPLDAVPRGRWTARTTRSRRAASSTLQRSPRAHRRVRRSRPETQGALGYRAASAARQPSIPRDRPALDRLVDAGRRRARPAGATGIRYSDYIYADPAHPYFSYQPPWGPATRRRAAGPRTTISRASTTTARSSPTRHVLVARPKLPLRALLARPVRGHLAVAAAAVDVAVAAAAVGLAVAPAAIGLAVAAAIGLAVTAAANNAGLQLSDTATVAIIAGAAGGGGVLLAASSSPS